MPQLVVKQELLFQLMPLHDETMIVDEHGKFCGLFTPASRWGFQSPASGENLSQSAGQGRWEPPITEEMVLRSQSKEKGISTAELLVLLESKRK